MTASSAICKAAVTQSADLQCGLDTSKKVGTPLEEQVSVFVAQLQLGKELKRPISVSSILSPPSNS